MYWTHTHTHTHTHADYVAYVCASCISQSLLSVCPPRHPDLSRLLLDVSFRLHVCRFVCMCKIIPDCGSIEHGDDCSKRKMMMMLERIFEQLFSYKYIYIHIYISLSREWSSMWLKVIFLNNFEKTFLFFEVVLLYRCWNFLIFTYSCISKDRTRRVLRKFYMKTCKKRKKRKKCKNVRFIKFLNLSKFIWNVKIHMCFRIHRREKSWIKKNSLEIDLW